jgi:hypothetical protein
VRSVVGKALFVSCYASTSSCQICHSASNHPRCAGWSWPGSCCCSLFARRLHRISVQYGADTVARGIGQARLLSSMSMRMSGGIDCAACVGSGHDSVRGAPTARRWERYFDPNFVVPLPYTYEATMAGRWCVVPGGVWRIHMRSGVRCPGHWPFCAMSHTAKKGQDLPRIACHAVPGVAHSCDNARGHLG